MDLRVISPRAEALLPFYERLGYKVLSREPFPPNTKSKIRDAHYIFMSKPLARPSP